jgi:hypothetical protein
VTVYIDSLVNSDFWSKFKHHLYKILDRYQRVTQDHQEKVDERTTFVILAVVTNALSCARKGFWLPATVVFPGSNSPGGSVHSAETVPGNVKPSCLINL